MPARLTHALAGRRWPVVFLVLLSLGVVLPGCGSSESKTAKTPIDAASLVDAVGDSVVTSDTSDTSTAADSAALDVGVQPADKPLSAVEAPAWVTPTGWAAAVQFSGGVDAIGAAVADGSFVAPEPNTKAYGKVWVDAAPKAGVIGPFGNGGASVWLVGHVYVPQDTAAIARLDRVSSVQVGGTSGAPGWRAPGDIYGHGLARVPLRLVKGDNVLILRARGGQKIRVTIETSEAELHLNRHDWTRPELREGAKKPLWLGLPLLEMTGKAQGSVRCRVMADAHWKETEVVLPGIAPLAVTHASFRLDPKTSEPEWAGATAVTKKKIPVRLRVESLDSGFAYEHEVELAIVTKDAKFRQTFRSPVDLSTQFYGVVPPSDFDAKKSYGVALSLHGAGVEGKGQANAYSPKDWMYVIAPTNRRRYGFDWEEWGHLNGLAALADATSRFSLDRLRTYVTGHSMGGHGTWQFGVHHAGMFAVVGPSAGWDSFYTYGGSKKPTGPFARARAHSDTSKFMSNISNRSIYVIHGDADNNVPISEGKALRAKAAQFSTDVQHHWEPGAGHWWNGDKAAGADCVDWPALFAMMQKTTLDPTELSFTFTSPGPWYSDRYSYARIRSAASPASDCKLVSVFDGATLKLTTTNVRTLEIDAKALVAKGITSLEIDGKAEKLGQETLILGPQTGKRPGVHGPFNQVMHTPWCWIWNDGAQGYAAYASYLSTTWAFIGNGQACALPASRLTAEVKAAYNLIHLGRTPAEAGAPAFISWDGSGATVGGKTFPGAAVQLIWDDGKRLAAAISAPTGQERLLWMVVPFSSRSGMPDFLLWSGKGLAATGNFDADWKLDPTHAVGL